MSSALTVQTVLYRTSPEAVVASASSIADAVSHARRAGLDGDVILAHGDAGDTVLETSILNRIEETVRSKGLEYSYTHFGFNAGSAAGQNLLAQAHRSAWHFVTNPDVILGASALTQLWQRTNDTSIGILEARQLPLELAKFYDPQTGDTSWASGACSLVRGDVWQSLDGYDAKTFFLYGDDVDLSWRVRLNGHRVVHVPTSRVFHDKRLGRDSSAVTDSERFYSAVGSYLLAYKWGTNQDRERVMEFISGDDYLAVRQEIDRLTASGALPVHVEHAERVAYFAVDGTVGHWRYLS